MKPLGRKAYGSIPHLPNSRLGVGDHHCHAGQAAICTETPRDKHDRVIVTEKLDGSCCAVARVNGEILAVGRAGYLATTSPYAQHHVFARWVDRHAGRFAALPEGWRVVGEWLYQVHGTRYEPTGEPFIPFDLIGERREPHDSARAFFAMCGLAGAAVLHDGGPLSVEAAMAALDGGGHHGAQDPVEGAVWRVERHGKFDFMAKFVRPDKVDGLYLANLESNAATEDAFNFSPAALGVTA